MEDVNMHRGGGWEITQIKSLSTKTKYKFILKRMVLLTYDKI